jgi:hypothetical protein
MALLGFQQQFAEKVERGLKLRSIRKLRKRPIKVGDTLHLYSGLRTKSCRKLGIGKCTKVANITITLTDIIEDGKVLPDRTADFFARLDGFKNSNELCVFFNTLYGVPFTGNLIEWELINHGL